MHAQSRNPFHERDHRISLMPIERPEGELSWLAGSALILALFVVLALGCAALGGL
jgi:hypothetical protein